MRTPCDYTKRMSGVDPYLCAVILSAAGSFQRRMYLDGKHVWIRITSGFRTKEQQQLLVDAKKSWTMESYHLDGRALDVAILREYAGKSDVVWAFPWYEKFNEEVQEASELILPSSHSITWGGDWKKRDGVHFQIEKKLAFTP